MLLIQPGEIVRDLEDAFLSYLRLSLYDVWCLKKEQFGSEGNAGTFSEGSSQSWENDSRAGDPENTPRQGKDLMAAHLGMCLNTVIDSQNHRVS